MAHEEPYSSFLYEGFCSKGSPFSRVTMFALPQYRPLTQVIPHEFGHYLGLAFYDDDGGYHDCGSFPTGADRLMRRGVFSGPIENPIIPDFGMWLRHEDWRKANDDAELFITNP